MKVIPARSVTPGRYRQGPGAPRARSLLLAHPVSLFTAEDRHAAGCSCWAGATSALRFDIWLQGERKTVFFDV